jgi:hypothetical protein
MHDCEMARSKETAQSLAKWRSDDNVWLDHVTLVSSDLEWLAQVRRLTAWNVKVPEGFYARLPHLEWLDVRGGSRTSADFVTGCRSLRYLAINQVRGLHDLCALSALESVELLSLYGLPQVKTLPSLKNWTKLMRLEVGSMKGLLSIAPLLDAPPLEELQLHKAVSLASGDPDLIAAHPRLREFYWNAEDVPYKVYAPVVERIAMPRAKSGYPSDWFQARDS